MPRSNRATRNAPRYVKKIQILGELLRLVHRRLLGSDAAGA
jgi:hypothetical protein